MITSPDGTKISDQAAEGLLVRLLHASSFRDFMITVYQHQEAIRALLTQEPRVRNDAIDRLLGLSDYRNLVAAIDTAKYKRFDSDLQEQQSNFESKLQTALETINRLLNQKRQEAVDSGIEESKLSEEGARAIASNILRSLSLFCRTLKIDTPTIQIPSNLDGIKDFRNKVEREIDTLGERLPGTEEETWLLGRQQRLLGMQSQLESVKRAQSEAQTSLQKFAKKKGNENELRKRLAEITKQLVKIEEDQRNTNARAKLVSEAICFLEGLGKRKHVNECPLCGSEKKNILSALKKEMKSGVEVEVDTIRAQRETKENELHQIDTALHSHKELDKRLKGSDIAFKEIKRSIGAFLKMKLSKKDDVSKLLSKEAKAIEKNLTKIRDALQKRQQTLNEIRKELRKEEMIYDFLREHERKKIVQEIQSSKEFQELEIVLDDAATFVQDVNAIRAAINSASREEASSKITEAEATIDKYFRKLSAHPAVTKMKLNVKQDSKGKNSYTITDQDGNDLGPVLSQGDLNSMALSIFLGLACSSQEIGSFSCVMLDDPSQSLGSEHKARFAELIDEVIENGKNVILSTMDRELMGEIETKVTKAGTTYHFSDWTPKDGPQIYKE